MDDTDEQAVKVNSIRYKVESVTDSVSPYNSSPPAWYKRQVLLTAIAPAKPPNYDKLHIELHRDHLPIIEFPVGSLWDLTQIDFYDGNERTDP